MVLFSTQAGQKKSFLALPLLFSRFLQNKITTQTLKKCRLVNILGVLIDANLMWIPQTECIFKKIKQCIDFLRRLKSFGASRQIISPFFRSVMQSVLSHRSTAWLSSQWITLSTSGFCKDYRPSCGTLVSASPQKEHAQTCSQYFCWPLSCSR